MISVVYDGSLNEVKKFINDQGMTWLYVFESSEQQLPLSSSLVKTFNVSAYPTFILIQHDGKIIATDFDEIV